MCVAFYSATRLSFQNSVLPCVPRGTSKSSPYSFKPLWELRSGPPARWKLLKYYSGTKASPFPRQNGDEDKSSARAMLSMVRAQRVKMLNIHYKILQRSCFSKLDHPPTEHISSSSLAFAATRPSFPPHDWLSGRLWPHLQGSEEEGTLAAALTPLSYHRGFPAPTGARSGSAPWPPARS